MSVPIFLFDPVTAPADFPRENNIANLCGSSSPSKDSGENMSGLPSSPSISVFSIGSSSKGKARKRLRDVFKSQPNSPGPLIISSPLRESMEIDELPGTPTRASKPSLLSSSPVKDSSSPVKGAMDIDCVAGIPRRISIPLVTNNSPEFESLLESLVDSMATDCVTSARQLASAALSHLATLIELAAETARVRQELWEMSINAAKQMGYANPAVSAEVTACLLRGLVEIHKIWDETMETSTGVKTPKELSVIAVWVVEKMLEERKGAGARLGRAFTWWIKTSGPGAGTTSNSPNKTPIRILTLGNSATIYTAIETLLMHLPTAQIHLTILETRPRFEGVELGTNLLTQAGEINASSRLHVRIVPDCAVARVVKDIDTILLGADLISANGDVCNTMGSLSVVICAKHQQPKAKVVVICDGDKIVSPNAGEWTAECYSVDTFIAPYNHWTKDAMRQVRDGIEIVTESVEWVPKDLIDVYLSENGPITAEEVVAYGEKIGAMESALFG